MKKLTLTFLILTTMIGCDSIMDYPFFSPKAFNNISHPLVLGHPINPVYQSGKFTHETRPGFFDSGVTGSLMYFSVFDLETLDLVQQFRTKEDNSFNAGLYTSTQGGTLLTSTDGKIWRIDHGVGNPEPTGLSIDFAYGYFLNIVTNDGSLLHGSVVLRDVDGKPSSIYRLVNSTGTTILRELIINTNAESLSKPSYDPISNRIFFWDDHPSHLPQVKTWSLDNGSVELIYTLSPGYEEYNNSTAVTFWKDKLVFAVNPTTLWNERDTQVTESTVVFLNRLDNTTAYSQTIQNKGYEGIRDFKVIGNELFLIRGEWNASDDNASFSLLRFNEGDSTFGPFLEKTYFGFYYPSPYLVGNKLVFVDEDNPALVRLLELDMDTKALREKSTWIY